MNKNMQMGFLSMPHTVYIDKTSAGKDYKAYGFLSLLSLCGFYCWAVIFFNFWLSVLMLICFILLIRETVKQYNLASKDKAVFAMTKIGIEIFHKDYIEVGVIPWSEIRELREIGSPCFITTLCIIVKKNSNYLDKIRGKSRTILMKFNTKNDIQCIFNVEAVLNVETAVLKRTVCRQVEKTNFLW